ncbi:hypothetical protein O181_123334, partial [Austropuccinia psidii MF-1]|nr:hypothetical protein [Austropuccinia psidii MF-1]
SPEADITAIPVGRPESFPAGNNRDIPVSVKELVYCGKEAGVDTSAKSLDRTMSSYLQVKTLMGPEKTEELLRGWTSISCKGKVQQIKAWLKNQSILSEDQKKKLDQGKDKSPVEAPQSSARKNWPQQVPNKDKQTPKSNQKEKRKAKGKAKSKWNKPYPQSFRIPKNKKTAMDNVFNMERTLMEFKKRRRKYLTNIFQRSRPCNSCNSF